jgi:hypothetical protein
MPTKEAPKVEARWKDRSFVHRRHWFLHHHLLLRRRHRRRHRHRLRQQKA